MDKLGALLGRADIWRAGRLVQGEKSATRSTGHVQLDKMLSGGWPQKGLMELLVPRQGIGELSLLLPALGSLSRAGHWLAWVQPPWIPGTEALQNAGLELSRLLILRAQNRADQLWALEQLLSSGQFGAVLGWPGGLSIQAQRRLQLAAEAGGCWGTIFSVGAAVSSRSAMAMLRLQLQVEGPRLQIKVLKARGGWSAKPVSLARHHVMDSAVFSPPSPGTVFPACT